jgi:lipopolysaccharide biosynthesis glycosyltransferase
VTQIHVACAAEGGYVRHSAAMLHSVLAETGPTRFRVHYLHDPALERESLEGLTRMVEGLGARIDLLPVPDERLAGLPTQGFTLKATWYRIFLPELLPNVDRILYLDGDLLALESVAELWATDLTGHAAAAVANVLPHHYAERLRAAGLDPSGYFNAGVLLMNLEQMRSQDSSAALLAYGREHADHLVLRDQDALNAVLGPSCLRLHPRWNCMNALWVYPWAADVFGAEVLAEARRLPAIRHFEGPFFNKPWHLTGDPDARSVYKAHRSATPWPRYLPEGLTAANVARRLLGRRSGNSEMSAAPLRDPPAGTG